MMTLSLVKGFKESFPYGVVETEGAEKVSYGLRVSAFSSDKVHPGWRQLPM
jgi:hypothetical protein